MVAVTHADLAVCGDCLSLLANGTVSDDLDGAADEAHAARMDAQWPDVEITLGSVEPTDNDGLGFSWSACQGCGSTLGGDRYAATAWVRS